MSSKIESLLEVLELERERRCIQARTDEDIRAHQMLERDEDGLSEEELHKRMEALENRNFVEFYRDSYEEETLLHHSICFGSLEYMRGLFKMGVPVEPQDTDGATALHYAAGCKQKTDYTTADDQCKKLADDKIRLLFAHGAELEVKDREGRTALAMAVEKGKGSVPSAITTLLELKCDPMARSHDGLTLLHYAALSNDAVTMQMVLDIEILRTPELRNQEAFTPMHYAGPISLPVLLRNGADMNAVTRKGDSPLDMIMDRHSLQGNDAAEDDRIRQQRADINTIWVAEKDRRSLPISPLLSFQSSSTP